MILPEIIKESLLINESNVTAVSFAVVQAEQGVDGRKSGTRINEERVRQAAETGADTLARCPFCMTMLSDGILQAATLKTQTRMLLN